MIHGWSVGPIICATASNSLVTGGIPLWQQAGSTSKTSLAAGSGLPLRPLWHRYYPLLPCFTLFYNRWHLPCTNGWWHAGCGHSDSGHGDSGDED